ncbi:hypothetical protein LguiB_019627 [Lonicera macranthoides]
MGWALKVAEKMGIKNYLEETDDSVVANHASHEPYRLLIGGANWGGGNSENYSPINEIPFLFWPYFADQLLNQSYICDVWNIGLEFNKDKRGIIMQNEIKSKVEPWILKKRLYMNSIKEGGCRGGAKSRLGRASARSTSGYNSRSGSTSSLVLSILAQKLKRTIQLQRVRVFAKEKKNEWE